MANLNESILQHGKITPEERDKILKDKYGDYKEFGGIAQVGGWGYKQPNAHEGIDSLIIMNKLDEFMKNRGQGYQYGFDTPRDRFGELGRSRLAQGDSTQFKILEGNGRNPIEALLKLISGTQNPLAGMLNPSRRGETLGQTWNEYTTGEINPNVVKRHQASIDSILGNYVNGLMNEKEQKLPNMQYQR